MLSYISPIKTYIEEFLDRLTLLNQRIKQEIYSNDPFFYCVPPKSISEKFTLNRDLCRFLQPGLIFIIFGRKLRLSNFNYEGKDLIPNDWKHIATLNQTLRMDGDHILSPDIWRKIYTDRFIKCLVGYIFSI